MRNLMFLLLLTSFSAMGQVEIVDYNTLEKEFNHEGDTLTVVNFWATTCKPCIEEFPFFIQMQEKVREKKVKFVYVSLDFSKQKDKVDQFILKKGLQGKQYLLKDDPNIWINKVDQDWGGDIPYTLLIKPSGQVVRHNQKFDSFEDLDKFIINNL